MEKSKTIITGVNGFVGHHLAKELKDNNIGVIGIGSDATLSDKNIENVATYYQADLTKIWPTIEDADSVIHLAGLAAVGPSFDSPQLYIDANSSMVTNMCEYYLKQEHKPRIVLVSSGTVYSSDQSMPLREDSALAFNSPYAVSKVLNENQATYYRNRGLDIVVARPFNHIGPGQAPGFLLPDLAFGIKNIANTNNTLTVGNLETKRDYTDVRDVVRAYRLLATTRKLGSATYNICTGRSVLGSEILDTLKHKMKADNINISVDSSKIRPTDPKNIFGDSSRLAQDTGWKPSYEIQQTISDFVDSL